MAHKLPKGTSSLLKTASSSARLRPVARTITGPQARQNIDERVCRCHSSRWSPFHGRQPGLNGIVDVGNSQREHVGPVSVTSRPSSCRWQGGRKSAHAVTTFNNLAYLTPEGWQWEEARDLEDCLEGNFVSKTADLSLINRRRQEGQESIHLAVITPFSLNTPSPLINRPHRRPPNAGAMPRCGYDTTHMHVAKTPRPAASAGGTGTPRKDKPRSDGNNGGSGNGRSSGIGDAGKGNGREIENNDSEKTKEQEPGRGNKDGEPTTEMTIDDIRIPLEGRGWTFWL